jgi:peptide/nickel transport system permease protein
METQSVGALSKLSRYVSVLNIKKVTRNAPWIPLTILLLFLVCGVFGTQLAPHDPMQSNMESPLLPPFWEEGGTLKHPLGTDYMGLDVLSNVMAGARVSLIVGFGVVLICATIGAIVGLTSGYLGGWTDTILMRITDIFLSMPALLFALVIASVLGAGINNMILVLTVLGWAGYARVLRGEVLRVKQGDFVSLSVIAGTSKARIMRRHILPNIANTMIIVATFHLGVVIVAESSLSFLGVGVPPPTPAWGSMCAVGRDYIFTAWWLSFFPGMAIFLVVLSSNLLGDWLRFRLDPKFRQL